MFHFACETFFCSIGVAGCAVKGRGGFVKLQHTTFFSLPPVSERSKINFISIIVIIIIIIKPMISEQNNHAPMHLVILNIVNVNSSLHELFWQASSFSFKI